MSRESKIFTAENDKVQKAVAEYESFGWELLSINGLQVSLTRETQNDVYTDLVKYEAQYEELKGKLNSIPKDARYKKASVKTALILLVLAIVPGVAYIVYKNLEKKNIQQKNDELAAERNAIEGQIEEVCNISRATFFAKQK